MKPRYVKTMPDEIKEGILYISNHYGTAVHKCPCGCKELIVTPTKKGGWMTVQNKDKVSLYPSVYNSTLPCKSHYWIRDNEIVWA